MNSIYKSSDFPGSQLIDWYNQGKRNLPWRQTKDPYLIWISEVILQQTRVQQGLPYYNRFIDRFKTVYDLAAASEDDVLKLWEGLGYYTRARNLHATAKQIAIDQNGEFPSSYQGLLTLKGIGPYTAAAIGSICFNLPEAAVDGNVFRVLARYYGIGNSIDETGTKKLISVLSNEALNRRNAGDHNQAMMELGATICTPKSPKCELCPLEINCVAKKKSLQSILPARSKKTKVRKRYFHYLVRISAGETFLVRRGEGDIWQGLYEFPMVESDRELNEQEMLKVLEIGLSDVVKSISEEYKHILSHQKISAKFVCVESQQIKNSNFIRVEVDKLSSFAFPRLIKRFLERKKLCY